jgi:hypothetical protein
MRLSRDCQSPLWVLAAYAVGACGAPDPRLDQINSAIDANTAVTWTNQVNTTVNGATITKTGGEPWAEDAGAASQQSVASGDAAFQYTVDEVNNFRFVGFGHTSTWQGAANIDYSFRMQAGEADVYEHNTWLANIAVGVGDVLKIDVVSGVAHYYKNGVLQFTSSQAPTYPLYVVTSMIDGNSTIYDAMISQNVPAGAVQWTNLVNTSVNGATITKTGGEPWAEDAGAASAQSIASGDGTFQYTVDEVNNFRFVGFGHTSTWQGAANIDYSFRMQSGEADVYEHNTWLANIAVAVGDVLKINVTGGVVTYYKNGVLQYTSSQSPTYPMYVITSMIDGNSTIYNAQITGGGGGSGGGGAACKYGTTGSYGHASSPYAWPEACWVPFASTSPFNTPLPASPRLRTNSAAIINRMLHFTADNSPAPNLAAGTQAANMIAPSDGTGGWPTYYGTSSDPTYTVTCSWGSSCTPQANGMVVHVPNGADIEGGNGAPMDSDRHLTIVDQPTGYVFDLWGVTSPTPLSGGGVIQTTWSGVSIINGTGLAQGTGEGTAARFSNIAGRIRAEELQAGVIDHALSIVINCDNGSYVYPASEANGQHCSDTTNAPPLGARLRLNMSTSQINALAIPAWKKTVLQAMATYGAFMDDTGSSDYFDWQLESGSQYTTVGASDKWLSFGAANWTASCCGYTGYTGIWQDTADGVDWKNQVWANLQVVDECVSAGNCN